MPDGTADADVTATPRDSQMRHTQTPGAVNLVTDTTVLTVSGDVSGDTVGYT